jgi:hypothetical protein
MCMRCVRDACARCARLTWRALRCGAAAGGGRVRGGSLRRCVRRALRCGLRCGLRCAVLRARRARHSRTLYRCVSHWLYVLCRREGLRLAQPL